jgi:thioredoxin 1
MMFLRKLFVPAFIGLLFVALAACGNADSAGSKPASAPGPAPTTASGLPRLVDLGADSCIPCKMMAPILDDLKKEYSGKMEVVFIDVWKKREEAGRYGIQLIPTQIFYGADGKELHRHQGFIGKDDILATWKRLGYEF